MDGVRGVNATVDGPKRGSWPRPHAACQRVVESDRTRAYTGKMIDCEADPNARIRLDLGEITHVTLNRPAQANALDWQMGEELEAAVSRIRASPGVRVVVLRGAGQHFCSGGDFAFIEENTRLGRAEVAARMLRFYQMYLSVLELEVPTLAVVQGSAIGAGLCLALACDLRIGSTLARLGLNFVRVGLHPGMGASALLPHVVGATRATELLMTGQAVSGERGASLGLLGEAIAPELLAAAAERTASSVASGAPLALRATVETLRAPLRRRLAEALPREAACQAADFGTRDVRLAIEAFRSKQVPVFLGR
jgi:enoyl-CoA hydratase